MVLLFKGAPQTTPWYQAWVVAGQEEEDVSCCQGLIVFLLEF